MTNDMFSILDVSVKQGASDVHFAVGNKPVVRINGDIRELEEFEVLTQESCKDMIYSVLYEDHRTRFERDMELDASFQIPGGRNRFRVNVFVQKNGIEAVIRIVPFAIPTPAALGLGETVRSLSDLPRGLVLVTGPTGSGKTTTLACLIEQINLNHRKNIITIEDPIEFSYQNKRSLVRQREIGPHTSSFKEALRHALRQDPDVIMVGEMRDLETISLAITAAETGHLCLGTLHTSSAAQSIDRIIDVFPPHQQGQVRVQLANSLRAVVSQILLPRIDVSGRVAAREILIVNSAVANLIREGKTHMIQNSIETGGKSGMTTMDKSLAELVRVGAISMQEALSKAQNIESLRGLSRFASGVAVGA